MIIIYVLFLTSVYAKKEKYIDRLPNEEDFLNEIARRMMTIDDYIDQIKENKGKENSESLREHKDNNTYINQENSTSGDLAVKPLKLDSGEYTYNNNEGLANENQNLPIGINKSAKNNDRDDSNAIFINKNKTVPETTAKAIQPVINTATYRTSYVPTAFTSNRHLTLFGRPIEDNWATTELHQPLTKSRLNKTAVNDKKTTEKPKTIKLIETVTKLDVDDVNNDLEENPVLIEKNELAAEENENLNHYKVYEIPLPNKSDNQPFFRNPEPINDQRFKMPLFEYFPKNAYYNTKKNLESNDKNLRFKSESDQGKSGDKNNNSFLQTLLSKVKSIKKYLLENYKKSRKHKKLHLRHDTKLSSNEIPLSRSQNSGLKTHIRTVRDIFKNKPLYHYTNPINNYKYIESQDELKKTLDNYKKTAQSPIFRALYDCLQDMDVDYYFGRRNRRYKKCHLAQHIHNLIQSNKKIDNFKLNHLGHHILDNNILNHINLIFGKHKKTKVKKNKHKYEEKKSKSEKVYVNKEKDFDNVFKNLEDTNLMIKNREFDVNIETYMKVLKNMILQDNKALKQYDWLKTAVQIQQALSTMIQIINQMKESRLIHSEDIEFLKHAVFINNLSSDIKKSNDLEIELKNLNKTRNIKQKIENIVEANNFISQKRINLRTLLPDLTVKDELSVLNEFLLEVQDGLYDFHEAIMNVAKVTQFNNQRWYDNLKELYLTSDEKHLREILLHISFSRLLDLVENGRKNGLQDDFVSYVKNNQKESKQIVEEIVFVSKILDEIKIN